MLVLALYQTTRRAGMDKDMVALCGAARGTRQHDSMVNFLHC